MGNPRQLVAPPAFTPLPYGLLTAVEQVPAGDTHWAGGITWQSTCLDSMGTGTWDECITVTGTGGTAPPPPPTKAATFARDTRGATPFTAMVEFDCSPVGNEEAQLAATNALAQAGSFQLERAFWTGQVAGFNNIVQPHLAAATQVIEVSTGALMQSVPVTGASADAAEALGYLEDQLATCYNGVGVIHVPTVALPTLVAWDLVTVQGATLRTMNGNRVAVGAGYPGTSPAGAAPAAGTTWMYATGAVFCYTGPVRVGDVRDGSFDRSKNTIKMIAERTYVLGWDCCHAGALVQLGVPVT